MRTVFLFLNILALYLTSVAHTISPEQATQVAINFYTERSVLTNNTGFGIVDVKNIRVVGSSNPTYFVCEMQPQGFVVVSASSKVLPVLAYSFESNYGTDTLLHEGFNAWMYHYQQQIEFATQHDIAPTEEVVSEW